MNLVEYLNGILKLKPEDEHNDIPIEDIDDVKLLDSEILELASQHDLPIFISIDGGYDQNGMATTSICILAPDIRDADAINGTEWQNRPAKILLIRSWCLPKKSINMAEAMGFIIGEYTIPANLPVIYITDSNNARSLQKRIKIKTGLRIENWRDKSCKG